MIKNQLLVNVFMFFGLIGLIGCSSNSTTDANEFNQIISQVFDIDAKVDQVIEGDNGTIVVCPKGCFKTPDGKTYDGKVSVELTEAFSLDDMILSNLSTTSDGKLLETDGMLHIKASGNGIPLSIDAENPIHVEIPTEKKKGGMMVYKGVRDEKGNINWIQPQQLNTYLMTVDLDLLDFLPEGFQSAVEKGMPFKGHTSANKPLTDSLYFALSVPMEPYVIEVISEDVIPNEPYYNNSIQVDNGEYIDNSVKQEYPSAQEETAQVLDTSMNNCGIDPAIIQVIKSKKYQNTFIATKEFEARLRVIFKTCNNQVLELYIQNIDKDLYVVDSIAASLVEGTLYYNDFVNFTNQKLTNVSGATKNNQLLKKYYHQQLAKVKNDLKTKYAQWLELEKKKQKKAEKLKQEYSKLLWKREKYRMERYGFDWKDTGWLNVDRGIQTKSWDSEKLEIYVDNGQQFDRLYSYVVYTSIKSLYRLNSDDGINFYVGNLNSKKMLMPNNSAAIAIVIGYKSDAISYEIQQFITGQEKQLKMSPVAGTLQSFKESIKPFQKYKKENQITEDLEFMAKFYAEKKRVDKVVEEQEFMRDLRKVAFPCCDDISNGKALFEKNCASCHDPGPHKTTGPGLGYASHKYSPEWLYEWTTNSTKLIKSGDEQALKVYNEYNGMAQPSFNLTRKEVSSIFKYIDDYVKTLP